MVMEAQGIEIPAPDKPVLYIAALGKEAEVNAFKTVKTLREAGLEAHFDIVGRGLKAQMKYADKIGAKFTLVLGDNEIAEQKAQLKNMENSEKAEIRLGENFMQDFMAILLASENKFN